jgi:hypothetical protein
VAIRPSDFQSAIWQASQTAPLAQRAEEAPRAAQQAAQAAFVADVETREERIDAAAEGLGNRVDTNAERDARGDDYEPRERRARTAPEPAGAAALDEPPHLIDFTA